MTTKIIYTKKIIVFQDNQKSVFLKYWRYFRYFQHFLGQQLLYYLGVGYEKAF